MTEKVTIDIWSDVMCPWCVIGYKNLEAALAGLEGEIEAEIRWLPFELNPDMPPEGEESRAHIARKYGRTPEQAEAFEQLFRAYVEPSRAEPGCIEYHMLRDAQDPTLFIFYEVWASREALAEHTALPHMRAFHDTRMDYLRRDFEIREIEMLSPARCVSR